MKQKLKKYYVKRDYEDIGFTPTYAVVSFITNFIVLGFIGSKFFNLIHLSNLEHFAVLTIFSISVIIMSGLLYLIRVYIAYMCGSDYIEIKEMKK